MAVAVAAAVVPAVALLVPVAVRSEAVAGHRRRDGGAGNVLALCRHTQGQRRRERGGVYKGEKHAVQVLEIHLGNFIKHLVILEK